MKVKEDLEIKSEAKSRESDIIRREVKAGNFCPLALKPKGVTGKSQGIVREIKIVLTKFKKSLTDTKLYYNT